MNLAKVIKELQVNKDARFVHPLSKVEIYNFKDIIALSEPSKMIFTEGWEKIQEPMTFQEAILKGKFFKVQSGTLEKYWKVKPAEGSLLEERCRKWEKGEWLTLVEILNVLTWGLTSKEVAEVLINGKWYVKEG